MPPPSLRRSRDGPSQPPYRWIYFALGFLVSKLACLLTGVVSGQTQPAFDILVEYWFRKYPLINFVDLIPYGFLVLYVKVTDLSARKEVQPFLRRGAVAGCVLTHALCQVAFWWKKFDPGSPGPGGTIMLSQAAWTIPAMVGGSWVGYRVYRTFHRGLERPGERDPESDA